MSVPSSGDRVRRGTRRPGWALLTVLLVLAIGASTALVFTNRVELLKLAVILALWAAVVGAFVSVIYRRQSDTDAARARDMKYVYDLQLEREISARREYELNVEANLRRELAGEIRAQSSDEVTALRAELASLRRSLEILFDADLSHRPALETERSQAEWTSPAEPSRPDRVASSRITEVRYVDDAQTAESPIIDVREEPLVAPLPPAPVIEHGGSHRRPSEDPIRVTPARAEPAARPEPVPRPEPAPQPEPAPRPEPVAWTPPVPPVPPSTPPRPRESAASNGYAHAAAPVEPDRRGRHGVADETPSQPAPAPRHRGPEDEHGEQDDPDAADVPTGQSVAELLARLQHTAPTTGGRRRRRED